jgi:hypothetical protein
VLSPSHCRLTKEELTDIVVEYENKIAELLRKDDRLQSVGVQGGWEVAVDVEHKILRIAEGLGLQRPSVFVEKDEEQVYAELNEAAVGHGTKKFCSVTGSTKFHDTDSIVSFLLSAVQLKAKDRREAIDAALETTK